MPGKVPVKEKKNASSSKKQEDIPLPRSKKASARYTLPVVLSCSCRHAFQDQHYGPGKRVHNPALKGQSLRCTVCSNVIR